MRWLTSKKEESKGYSWGRETHQSPGHLLKGSQATLGLVLEHFFASPLFVT